MTKETISRYLENGCKGHKNVVSSRELERALGISGNELRRHINRLRRGTVPIAADQRGYYYAETAAEVYATIRSLEKMRSGLAVLDELYLWLSNPVAIEYIRNCLKRVRKRDSALVMASQNLEDFDQEGVREMTKPLFAIPPHQFLFNPGSIGKQFYMDMLQLDEAEFELIQRARRGECLYKCGMERYHLEVKAPTHKAVLFGSAGGR